MTGIIGKTLFKKKKSKNKKTTDLLVTWPPSWIAMVKRGLMSQASPNELREFLSCLSSSFSLFHGFHTFICTRTASKNTQKKSNTQRQVSTARTTAQPPKGFIAPKLLTRGRYSTNVYTGRLRPEVQPGTFLYTIFHEKVTPFVYLLLTNGTPFT